MDTCADDAATATDMPFGGYKASGSGREGEPVYSHSLDGFLETKTVLVCMSGAK